MSSDSIYKGVEDIALRIAQKSKRQRHYFEDDEEVSQSRRVKGLWTSGREEYGLEKIFVYVPAQSEIPLKDLSNLLSQIDGKLERAGRFRRVLCAYGDIKDDTRNGQGSILTGHFKIGADQWLAALTLMTELGKAPVPIPFTTFGVPYKHAFGSKVTTRPRREDPIIIVAPHRKVTVSEKIQKAMRSLRKNLTWVFHDPAEGWSMETKSYLPELAREKWQPTEELINSIQQRILDSGKVCEAFTASHEEFMSNFLKDAERETIPKEPTTKEYYNLVSKCLHEPVFRFFTKNSLLNFDDCGARMTHDLIDNQLISIEKTNGVSLLLEVRQGQLFLEDNRKLFEATLDADYDREPLTIVVAGDLQIRFKDM